MHKALSSGSLVTVLLLACTTVGAPARAAGADAHSLRPDVYARLKAAQRCAKRRDFECAHRRLDDLAAVGHLKPYEQAVRYQLLAYVEFGEGHDDAAIAAYQHLLEQPGLPQRLRKQTLYTLSQLYLKQNRADLAVGTLGQWFAATAHPTANAFLLEGQAQYRGGHYAASLAATQRAIGMARAAGRQIPENWYHLLAVLYFKTGDERAAADTFEQLIRLSPQTPKYYEQLAGLSLKLGDRSRALELLEGAHAAGWLDKPADLEQLATLLTQAGRDGEAARVMRESRELQARSAGPN